MAVLDAEAESSVVQGSWRGDVEATVRCPIRASCAIDFTGLAESDVAWDRSRRILEVRVPGLFVASVECDLEAARSEVSVGWGRFRSRAGEYWLGGATSAIPARAREVAERDDCLRQARAIGFPKAQEFLSAILRAIDPEARADVHYR